MKIELVTTLKQKTTEIISQVTQDPEPVLITQHGKPAAYLVDVSTYEVMESRISILEGIAKGEKAIEDRRVKSTSEAKAELSR